MYAYDQGLTETGGQVPKSVHVAKIIFETKNTFSDASHT